FDRAVTLIRQPGWQKEGPTVSNWAAHYNREDKACYLKFTTIAPTSASGGPMIHDSLYNVLENREVAYCVDEPVSAGRSLMCDIASDGAARGDCLKCKTFIAERMSQ